MRWLSQEARGSSALADDHCAPITLFRHNGHMAVKAILVDDEGTHHLVIGLNREDVESLLRGDVFTLPSGPVPTLTENKSDIVVIFAETDKDLEQRFPPSLRPQ